MEQADLFDTASKFPPGLRCVGELISHAVEKDLVNHLQELEFKPFEFHGYLGKRRIVSFGWRYDYAGRALRASEPMPDFLLPLRERAADLASLDARALQQALVTEYEPGVTIGWHRDKPMFEDVLARLERGQGLGSTLAGQLFEARARFGTEPGVGQPVLRFVNNEVRRHDGLVAGQHDRRPALPPVGRVFGQGIEPFQLVVELG